MKPTEKDIVIEKIKEMPAEEVAKVLIFIAGMEAGWNLEWEFRQGEDKK